MNIGSKAIFLPKLAGRGLAACLEAALSPRGLAIGFLLLAITLTTAGWLRPPLSPDIGALDVSLLPGRETSGEQVLHGPRRPLWNSPGAALLILLGASTLVAAWLPKRLGTIAGLILSAAVAANMAVALNHPGLIELLDSESRQRESMSAMLGELHDASAAHTLNARIDPGSVASGQLGDLLHGPAYLAAGKWLVLLASLGVLLSPGRPPLRRAIMLPVWLCLGILLGAAVCSARLRAEAQWCQAKQHQHETRNGAARQSLEAAVATFPQFNRLRRTCLLAGRLDYCQGRKTTRRQFWRAAQFTRNNDRAQANALIRDILSEKDGDLPLVRRRMAGLLVSAGLQHYRKGHFAAADDAWRTAVRLDLDRIDSRFYLGLTQIRNDPDHPETLNAELAPLLDWLADRPLKADLLTLLGDAYFEAGRMSEARSCYRQSIRLFNLPKVINYRAQKGLGGI